MNIWFWILAIDFVIDSIIKAIDNKHEMDKFNIIDVILGVIINIYILYKAVQIGF